MSAFCEQSFFKRAHKEDEFLHLMRCLVELKKSMPDDIDSLLYLPSREILIKGIQLAPLAMQSEGGNGKKERISALSETIQAATKVIQHPGDQTTRDLLAISIETMRSSIEGPSIFRKENRLLCGLIGVSLTLLGTALLVGGFSPTVGALAGVSLLLSGSLLATLGITMLLMGTIFYNLSTKNELQLSREIACTLKNIAANNPAAFFGRRDAHASELQPLVPVSTPARGLKAKAD